MDELILNEFYNKILPAVKSNNLLIDDWNFNIEFQTIIRDTITEDLQKLGINEFNYINYGVEESLIINDIKLFNEVLIIYVKKMFDLIINSDLKQIDYVYFNGNKTYIIDFILANMWSNVTDYDLQNPISYIKNRINFLDDEFCVYNSDTLFLENISSLSNSNIEFNISLNNPILETPYSFNSKIVRNENEIFNLPRIFYGISNKVCYIYAIQQVDKNDINNSYVKHINRILYKANKDVKDNYELDNIKDVTVSALFALTIFLKFLRENNILEIKVIDYLPIRYKAKEKSLKNRIDTYRNKNVDESKITKIEEKFEVEHDYLQNNITNKFIRNFRRLEYQLGTLKIKSFPKDVDSMMHIELSNNFNEKTNILNEIDYIDSNLIKGKKL